MPTRELSNSDTCINLLPEKSASPSAPPNRFKSVMMSNVHCSSTGKVGKARMGKRQQKSKENEERTEATREGEGTKAREDRKETSQAQPLPDLKENILSGIRAIE